MESTIRTFDTEWSSRKSRLRVTENESGSSRGPRSKCSRTFAPISPARRSSSARTWTPEKVWSSSYAERPWPDSCSLGHRDSNPATARSPGRAALWESGQALLGVTDLRTIPTRGEGEEPCEGGLGLRGLLQLLLDDAEQVRDSRVAGILLCGLLHRLFRIRPLSDAGERLT